MDILLLSITILANFFLAFYVLFRNYRNIVNRSFFLFVFTIIGWGICTLMIKLSTTLEQVMIVGKLSYVIAAFIPCNMLLFVTVFPYIPKVINKRVVSIPYLLGAIFSALSFSNLILKQVENREGEWIPIFGPLYPLYALFLLCGFFYACAFLYKKWKVTKSQLEKSQFKYLFIGTALAIVLGVIFNLLLPMVGIARSASFGPISSIIVTGFTAYAIVRYRLFDITVVVKKTAIYTLLTGSVTAFYIVGVLLAERLFREYQTFIPAVFAALVIAFVFLPLREKVQELVDRLFGKKRYEYQKILKEMGKELSKVLTMPRLLRYILKTITEAMGIDGGSIYLREGNRFQAKATSGEILTKKVPCSQNSSLVLWMKQRKDVVIREELERMKESKKVQNMKNSLDEIDASIAIPIIRENVLTGIIFLKSKSSGDMFTEEDINLLLTVANQAGVAIENARLYTQVEQAKIYQENILKNLASAVIVTDKDDRIRIFNEKAEQITGLSASKVIGKEHRRVLPDVFSQFISDAKNFEKGFSSHEIEYFKDKGNPIILGAGTAVMKDKNNKITGVTLVLADLTVVRTLEHQLDRAEELATVGTLAAGMAHEIKNPLVAINTFLELLPDKYDDPKFRGEFSEAAREEVKRINDLIHRLLNFAQPKPPNFTLCHIHKCIDESLKFMNTKLNNHNITVVRDYSPKVPESFIDKTRFDEVLLNFILNSIEAMERKGEGKLYIATFCKKVGKTDKIFLKIRDTGEGIHPEDLPRVFDPFFSTKDNGTGLGLAIVYRAITDHGGTIEVESKLNKGTTFLISLPVFSREPKEHKLVTLRT